MMTLAIDINDVIRDNIRQFITYYKKGVDPKCELKYEDVTDSNFENIFPFLNGEGNPDQELYNQFRYEDYAYELYARADVMERVLPVTFNLWVQNTLRDFDDGNNPDVIIVSPFEMNLTIQSTLSFLARIGVRTREFYFPIDSQRIWDKCDVLITANPDLIKNKPEGKIVIKINTPYNKEVEADYTFNTLCELINDEKKTVVKLLDK